MLVVTEGVVRGETIRASHLEVAELPADSGALNLISSEQIDDVIGQVATADLLPGTTLTPQALAPDLAPGPGLSYVGLTLSPNQMPAYSLTAGDQVRIVDTPGSQGEPPVESPNTISATVLSVTVLEQTGQRVVDLQVPTDEAAALAARAVSGRVALILDGPS